jgi:hypothetical protein
MDLTNWIWLGALAVLGLLVMGLMFLFVKVCEEV